MDKLDFVEGIKILSSCYQKVISNDDISIWYEMLQDIEPEVFKKAIIELCKERTYMPTIHDILDKTKVVKNNYYLSILEQMKKDGYFKLGVVPLSPEQEEKGIISKEELYELLEVPRRVGNPKIYFFPHPQPTYIHTKIYFP